ncbi:aldo/keto reductase [Paenibacillus cremeus]|uniref:Aldo/keto reductase n=1 Tax=Paenibacillus cremeus TaxID=2163881 RepID=A0A559KI50_9BACL|nr:aldo/keto reductase [Paenibacillus cremeus]TVY11813.1 aldo/keto reductase [Paenibacillus cremeus]
MRKRSIPGTALTPSVICLGSSHFGDTISRELAFELMDRFVDWGGTFLDTAKVYCDWVPGERSRSEKIIGEWLSARGSRSEVVLATKGAHPELESMQISRLSRADIQSDVEQSLRNLQTDYIDLYWLHRDDPERPVEDVIETMNELVREGKIRYFGCSNWRSQRIEAAQQAAVRMGLQGFVASQTKWSLASYPPASDPTLVSMDAKELAYHRETGLTAIPYNAQASGFFSGRYRSEMLQEPTAANQKVWKMCSEDNLRKLRAVEALSEELDLSMTQVALGYLLSQPFPVFPISGCKTVAQLDDSCAAGDVVLDRAALAALEGSAAR